MNKLKNPEAYRAARQWLQDNDPIDILDNMPGGHEAEKIYREFYAVYCNQTNAKDYKYGYYSPLSWSERAIFTYGYMLGRKSALADELDFSALERQLDKIDIDTEQFDFSDTLK